MDQTKFPADEIIAAAAGGNISAAAELDHSGFLVQPGETAAEYGKRIAEVKKLGTEFFEQFDSSGSMEIYPGLTVNLKDRIPAAIMEEAAERTEQRYRFKIRWVPGFFPEKEFGLLWGGCAVWQEERPVPVIVIRRNFLKKQKWFIYDRQELISHELSHAARMPLMDGALEEHFAYALSKKAFRRTLGNCFQRDTDAIFFVLPALLLAFVQALITIFQWTRLPIFPFWILALLWPVFLLIRNAVQTGNYKKARKHLAMAGFTQPDVILYRSVYPEICTFAETRPDQLNALLKTMAEKEFRWKVILEITARVQEEDR